MLPSLSRVMPHGLLNSPSPLPLLPYWARNLPSGVNTCRRSLPLSTTIRLPSALQMAPAGFSPFANELAAGVEHRDRVGPLVGGVDVPVLVHRDAERPDGFSVFFSVFAVGEELSQQLFLV